MSAKVMIAGLSSPVENSPLAANIRKAGRWLVQRIAPAVGTAERVLAVEERISIGPKKALVLIRCHDQQFLVATAGDNVGPIMEIPSKKTVRRSGKKGKE